MKKTPMYSRHLEKGAKMVPFARFMMPVHFSGIIQEHERVRERVGIFDISHMGEIEIRGEDCLEFVNEVTSNDASKLSEGRVQYSLLLLPSGGIVDETLVYRQKDRFMLVVNAVNTEKDYEWLLEQRKGRVEVLNRSEETGALALQGPLSERVMQRISHAQIADLRYYSFMSTEIAGEACLLSRTGYTGEDGFEVFAGWDRICRIWDAIMDESNDFQIQPAGLGARDTLRLEMRYCLYGSDVDETTTPLEAGLGWIVGWDKEEFVGRDVLMRQRREGVSRKLVGFELERGIPRPDYDIFCGGDRIGRVTSGTYSPSLRKGIGIGYVDAGHHRIGTEVEITGRGRYEKAVVVKTPFYKNPSHK